MLCMIALDACMLLWLSSIDGEQFMGDQEYYFDEQDQQERFIQGKYSMGLSLFPINFNTFNSSCMCHLDRDSLELNLYLVSYGICIG